MKRSGPRKDTTMHSRRRLLASVVVALAAAFIPSRSSAQYFGGNKVRYETFDFEVLKTQHFDIYYYPGEKEAVEQSGRLAERWYARLSRLLGHRFARRQPLILYANHPHFEQTNALMGQVGEGTGGATEALKRRVVMPFAGPLAETDHVLGHELVHAFQYDMTSGGGRGGGLPTALQLPLWFIEGMAEYLSVGPEDPHTAMWMRDAARRERMPTIRQLEDPRFFPYRYGQALWAYIAGRWGDDVVGQILRAAARNPNVEGVLEQVLGIESKKLAEDWHRAVRDAYRPILDGKQLASRVGRPLITERNAGELNVGPVLSPDGRQIVFLSEKGLFDIEMFLADAVTGEVRRKIVKRAVDPHFDSLQFIRSSGDWDAAGRRFAFAAIRKGKPVVSILDVGRGRTEREVRLPELGEVHDPTWSPDGRYLAFSANVGGLLDLYTYDLQRGTLRRLTDDAFAELQPAWSPDGRSIAYVTDRFTSRLADLHFGEYRLALMDAASGAVVELPSFEGAKNIDPQWSTDGRSLFFISDRNGISNVYRLDLAGRGLTQVTDLVTGASGITALSPALSAGGGRIVFSAYEDEKYAIYSIDEPAALAGQAPTMEGRLAAMLPPFERRRSEVVRLVDNPTLGLPDRRVFSRADYKPSLSLDYVGQTGVTVGADPLGTYVGGGVSFLFSDMLGDHNVGALIQASGDIKDLGGLIAYENRRSRWSWGGALEQIPFAAGSLSTRIVRLDGQDVVLEQAEIFREIHRTATAYAAYPFSRVQRFELSAAFRNISFDREIETQGYSLVTGQLLLNEQRDLDAPAGLSLGEASAALVYDSSIFGATSPILGRRWRLEVSPTIGTIRYTGVLADFRQYVMPIRPITLAGRLIHYGRYGGGGDEGRLTPLYIGYPNLVRGYDIGSFNASECGPDPEGACPVFDRLLGSRVLIGNVELRFPPFGLFSRRSFYGPLPIELLAFADGGVAWTSGEKASFFGGDREPVTSVGFGARMNVFGYAVVEVDYVRPLDRPQKGWLWQFNISPGF